MENYEIIKHRLGKMTAVYTVMDGSLQFTLVPSDSEKYISEDKLILKERNYSAPDSAIQVHVFGDRVNKQYSAGQSMRNSRSAFALKYVGQTKKTKGKVTEIVSRCEREDGQFAEHHLLRKCGDRFLECYTVYGNDSDREITLEMLSSFSIGSLTPFRMDNVSDSIDIYRMRSQWSAEAKLEKMSATDLLMEPSWMNYGVRGERFGSIGSMPSRKFMPFIGVTDRERRVTWAASLAWAGSWQMEFYLAQDSVNISGGLADYEFGHWRKTLKPGERLETPHAFLVCVSGGIDKAAQYLTEAQLSSAVPEAEQDLPVLYNEYCRNWGKCSEKNLIPAMDAAAALGAKVFVIDAGWSEYSFDKNGRRWSVREEYYPDGLESVVSRIHSLGMRAGVWFEPESFEYEGENEDLPLLKRDGRVIRNLERVFLDMTDKKARHSLDEGVTGFLKKYCFDYVKFDYNENIGVGCDGAESPAEGLRKNVNAVYDFYRSVKKAMPELTVEMCSSGGMRCEPSIISLGDMMSFSDIHEALEEPIVACDIQRVLHPVKNQVWATLHPTDSDDRLIYTLACGFYGRLCLSGPIDELSAHQSDIVRRAVAAYRLAVPVIKDGFTYFIGKTPSQRHPKGYKGCIRVGNGGHEALVVVHAFEDAPSVIKTGKSALRSMRIKQIFAPEGVQAELSDGSLTLKGMRDFTATVVLVERNL